MNEDPTAQSEVVEYFSNLIKNSKHFCILPWIHFHSWPNGKIMPCCVADSNLPVGNLHDYDSIIDMMNSPGFNKIRLAMLNDQPSPECKRCYDIEEIGTWTLRQSHNTRRGMDNIESVMDTNDDGSIDVFKLKYMDIRFSNICNMKCRTCGPGCSSQWAQEYIKTEGEIKYREHFKTDKIVVNSNEDQKLLNKLKPYLNDVEEVYFAGGEIIITPEHYECLDHWINNGLAEQIELTYTTNFSVLKYKNRNLIELWKKFPKLQIWASLDGEGAVAELLRHGSNWNEILQNVKTLKQLVPHAKFQITPTISIWNVWDFPQFFDTLVSHNLIDLESAPRVNLLTSPWYANIMILPGTLKMRLSLKYEASERKYRKINDNIANVFKMIKYNLWCSETNINGLKEFIEYNNKIDALRNEDILLSIPSLKELYTWSQNN
jgi:hypothetical protein